MVFQGCTKEVPLQALYSNDDSWTPQISITYNNYQRIRGVTGIAPGDAIIRNIDSCAVQVRPLSGDTSYNTICYANVYFHDSPGNFESGGILQMGTDYKVRLATYYHDGVRRYSEDTIVLTSIVKGSIVKSIIPTFPQYFGQLWFENGSIVTYTENWWSVDTSNGASHVFSQFQLPSQYGRFWWNPIAFNKDTAYFILWNYHEGESVQMLKCDINTISLDSNFYLERCDGNLVAIAVSDSKIGVIWWPSIGQTLVVDEYDVSSGKLMNSVNIPRIWVLNTNAMAYVDTSLWVSYSSPDTYNRIGRIDFSTGAIADSTDIPVYQPMQLVWDGTHFWVWDAQTAALVKLQLDGP